MLLCTFDRIILKETWTPGIFTKLFCLFLFVLAIFTAGIGSLIFSIPLIIYYRSQNGKCKTKSEEYKQKGFYQGELISSSDLVFPIQEVKKITVPKTIGFVYLSTSKLEVKLGFLETDSFADFAKQYPKITIS